VAAEEIARPDPVSSFRIAIPPAVERAAVGGVVGLLAIAAWIVLWAAKANVHDAFHLDGRMAFTSVFRPSILLTFVGAWTVMSIAMMLPTSLPVLTTLRTFASSRPDRPLLIALAASGYLAAWMVFGVLAGPVSLGLQKVVTYSSGQGWLDRLVAPALLLAAGLFQFSALKYRCLEKCRSPLSIVLSHWRGQHQRWEAFRLGWASGVFCVGCCWALMLLMFLSSVGHLAWMLGLGLVMAVEKNVRWGRRLSAPLGIVLIVGAGIVAVAGGTPELLVGMAREFCGTR
jgi:predicted metal-binding membrane protein